MREMPESICKRKEVYSARPRMAGNRLSPSRAGHRTDQGRSTFQAG